MGGSGFPARISCTPPPGMLNEIRFCAGEIGGLELLKRIASRSVQPPLPGSGVPVVEQPVTMSAVLVTTTVTARVADATVASAKPTIKIRVRERFMTTSLGNRLTATEAPALSPRT